MFGVGAAVVTATIGALAVITGATEMLGAGSAYGSIGHMLPEGPAYELVTLLGDAVDELTDGPAYGSIGIAGPDGPVANARGAGVGLGNVAVLELDTGGAAGVVGGDGLVSCGSTSQRPAA
jgi:hypothetical protein